MARRWVVITNMYMDPEGSIWSSYEDALNHFDGFEESVIAEITYEQADRSEEPGKD